MDEPDWRPLWEQEELEYLAQRDGDIHEDRVLEILRQIQERHYESW